MNLLNDWNDLNFLLLLSFPALLGNINTVTLGVMDPVFRERNSVRPGRAAWHAGFFRPRLHFFVAFDVEAEVVKTEGLFFPLIQERQIHVTVGDENR